MTLMEILNRKYAVVMIAAAVIAVSFVKAEGKTYNRAPEKPVAPTEAVINNSPPEESAVMNRAAKMSKSPAEITEKVNQILTNTETSNVYYTTPGERASVTQAAIDNPSYTIICWTPGRYRKFSSIFDCYNLKPSKTYILDGAIMDGLGSEHQKFFRIVDGGPINVLAINNSDLENVKDGFYIGNTPFDDIVIEGLDWHVERYGTWMNDVKNLSPLEQASVRFNLCGFYGGSKAFKIYADEEADVNSSYGSLDKCTISDMETSDFAFDMPIVPVGGVAATDSSYIILGQDELNQNLWDNCVPINPNIHEYLNSPQKNRYYNVVDGFYGEPEDDNMDIDANDLYNGTLQPIMFLRAHTIDGAAGRLPPVATMASVEYFTDCWLSQGNPTEPDDLGNDVNYDVRADFNKDGRINFIDWADVAESYEVEGS